MSPADQPLPINRRRALTALVLGVAAPTALAACVKGPGKQAAKEEAPPKASLTFTPSDAAKDVLPTAPVTLQVKDGWLQHVALTNADGKAVAGQLNRDRTAFTATEPLGYGASYTWSGSAVGRDGQALPIAAAFTTIEPTKQVNGQFQLSDGQTVGVAAPIILQFDAAIDDDHRADVEKALTVTTTPPNEGSWAWLPDEAGGSRVHWRTREYYQPGTKVHVDARLYGVKFGDDAYGAADSTLDFEIGRKVARHFGVRHEAVNILDHPLRFEHLRGAYESGAHWTDLVFAHYNRIWRKAAPGAHAIVGYLGGPPVYVEKHGHPRLRSRHFGAAQCTGPKCTEARPI